MLAGDCPDLAFWGPREAIPEDATKPGDVISDDVLAVHFDAAFESVMARCGIVAERNGRGKRCSRGYDGDTGCRKSKSFHANISFVT
jgi:hypothetical protein